MSLFNTNKNWTLFLDRDGVINHEMHLGYVNNWEEFVFYEGITEAFALLAKQFKYICIVTNQRGIARGITTTSNLQLIHQNMTNKIIATGGRIDGIYFCPDMELDSPCRKPNTGMALQAQQQFPDIDFTQSIMVGNNISDMEFGRNIGAKTIFLPTTKPDTDHAHPAIDAVYASLYDFALAL